MCVCVCVSVLCCDKCVWVAVPYRTDIHGMIFERYHHTIIILNKAMWACVNTHKLESARWCFTALLELQRISGGILLCHWFLSLCYPQTDFLFACGILLFYFFRGKHVFTWLSNCLEASKWWSGVSHKLGVGGVEALSQKKKLMQFVCSAYINTLTYRMSSDDGDDFKTSVTSLQ